MKSKEIKVSAIIKNRALDSNKLSYMSANGNDIPHYKRMDLSVVVKKVSQHVSMTIILDAVVLSFFKEIGIDIHYRSHNDIRASYKNITDIGLRSAIWTFYFREVIDSQEILWKNGNRLDLRISNLFASRNIKTKSLMKDDMCKSLPEKSASVYEEVLEDVYLSNQENKNSGISVDLRPKLDEIYDLLMKNEERIDMIEDHMTRKSK